MLQDSIFFWRPPGVESCSILRQPVPGCGSAGRGRVALSALPLAETETMSSTSTALPPSDGVASARAVPVWRDPITTTAVTTITHVLVAAAAGWFLLHATRADSPAAPGRGVPRLRPDAAARPARKHIGSPASIVVLAGVTAAFLVVLALVTYASMLGLSEDMPRLQTAGGRPDQGGRGRGRRGGPVGRRSGGRRVRVVEARRNKLAPGDRAAAELRRRRADGGVHHRDVLAVPAAGGVAVPGPRAGARTRRSGPSRSFRSPGR